MTLQRMALFCALVAGLAPLAQAQPLPRSDTPQATERLRTVAFDLALVAPCADRVALLADGRLRAQRSRAKRSRWASEHSFMTVSVRSTVGSPTCTGWMAALP